MEQKTPSLSTSVPAGGEEQSRLNSRECGLKDNNNNRFIKRENTKSSKRFSASNITSFREETRPSFRSNLIISSTASSPGYSFQKDEIDPSTYSFTNALKALQVRSRYNVLDCLSPSPSNGLSLNSKWNEAEKYISNPLSGQIPIECLSSKPLSGRRSILTNSTRFKTRYTFSGPLVYSSSSPKPSFEQTNPSMTKQEANEIKALIKEEIKKEDNMMKRDVGTQSTPPNISPSSSPISPTSSPSVKERSSKKASEDDEDDSPFCDSKSKIYFDKDKVAVAGASKIEEKQSTHEVATKSGKKDVRRNRKNKKQQKQKCTMVQLQQEDFGCCSCSSWLPFWMKQKV